MPPSPSRIASLRQIVSLAALIVLSCLAVFPVHGQVSTAAVNGTIRDTSGALVPEAEIILRNVNTNVEIRTVSNAAGLYVILNVTPGSYTLQVGKAGFTTQTITVFTLRVNQTATFDVALAPGAVQQTVTVEATGAEVQASTAELGAVVGGQQVMDLPLNGRNFTQLLTLSPGAAPVNSSQNSGGWLTGAVGAFTFPSINGQSNRSNFFLLDGITNYSSILSTYALAPVLDSIQEFKVQSHNDQAEFGQAVGGVVNVVTKSGTNDLHGTAWEYLKNDAFNARSYFLPSVTPFRWNQFGASAGGPVVLPKIYNGKNKTFFYLGYQGFRFRQPANSYYRVPTEANLRGDLSDEKRQIYDPFSTRPDPVTEGAFVRNPFPGNQIPGNLLHSGMVHYAQTTLPAPVFTGVADRNALDASPYRQNQEEYTARADHAIRGDFLWFRYSGTLQDNDGSGGRQALASLVEFRAKNVGASWVHTFSPTSVLQVQFGRAVTRYDSLARFRSDFVPDNVAFAEAVGFSPSVTSSFITGRIYVPPLGVTDFFSGGENDGLQTPTSTWQEKANYSKIWGNHTFKMGGEVSSMTFRQLQQNMSISILATQTADPQNPGNTGSSLASFLLNLPDNYFFRNTDTRLGWGGVISAYFQDQWKVTPRLTVNLGLRYDRTVIPPMGREEDGSDQVGDLDLIRGLYVVQRSVARTPSCSQKGAAPCIPTPDGKLPPGVVLETGRKLFHDSTKNFQPRVGLAYRVRQRTAIRASFGVFFDNWAGITQIARNHEGTWPSTGARIERNLNYPTASQPTPSLPTTSPIMGAGPLPPETPFQSGQYFFDPYLQIAYSLQWNFGIQHQIGPSTVVTANYVGSGGRRLDMGGVYNTALTPGPGDHRLRAPFPNIIATTFDRSWGRSNYNALQFLLDRKSVGDLGYMFSYTWSKSIDSGCSGWFGVEGCAIQDPYQFNNDRSVSAFDLTHVLTANWTYRLPVGPGKRFNTGSRVADHILGNWQINGIVMLRSGQPYTINMNGDIANTGNASGYMRPNLVGNPTLSSPSTNEWFNRAAFAAPAAYTFGNFGRNRLRSDWVRNFDLSVFRQFPITESRMLEVRVESFNVFNTPTFGVPTNNMSSTNFGRVLGTANSPRQLQLGAKIFF